jgi:hypothetical protein
VSGEFRHYTIEHGETVDEADTLDTEECDICIDQLNMRARGAEFLNRLADHEPPSVDESAATLAALKALHPGTRNDKRAEIEPGLWHLYDVTKETVSAYQGQLRKAEARIRDQIGEAGVITVAGEVVGYRRITHVKEHTRKAGTRDMIVRATTKETTEDA